MRESEGAYGGAGGLGKVVEVPPPENFLKKIYVTCRSNNQSPPKTGFLPKGLNVPTIHQRNSFGKILFLQRSLCPHVCVLAGDIRMPRGREEDKSAACLSRSQGRGERRETSLWSAGLPSAFLPTPLSLLPPPKGGEVFQAS